MRLVVADQGQRNDDDAGTISKVDLEMSVLQARLPTPHYIIYWYFLVIPPLVAYPEGCTWGVRCTHTHLYLENFEFYIRENLI
jgi:hypothetical protein